MDEVAFKPLETSTKFEIPENKKLDLNSLIILYGQRVIASKNVSNTTAILYTVPQGYTFFMFSITSSITLTGAPVDASDEGNIFLDSNAQQICNSKASTLCPSGMVCSNPSIPLILNQGEIIRIASGAAWSRTYANIFGYIVRNSDISNFFK
jgi:hypothetical protein